MSRLTSSPAWQALEAHWHQIEFVNIPALFQSDPARAQRFSLEAAGLTLDYSKQAVTAETLEKLCALARERDVPAAFVRLMGGGKVNFTEDRPALHTALRGAPGTPAAITREVESGLVAMDRFCHAVHSGQWLGHSGEAIRDVVNIGIGGSDLGPRLVCAALSPLADRGLDVHFVSNVDGADITARLDGLDPATTLFVVTSKSFSTAETLTNAATARDWLVDAAGSEAAVARHFVAVSARPDRALEFGINQDNVFAFQDWVGGRYSLWSPVGLPIALTLGMDRFRALLAGARVMDEHALNALPEANMPVLMGLMEIWNTNFRGAASQAIVPYAERLALLPAYLQQLETESGGKGATHEGEAPDYTTARPVWGGVGSNAQHAFFQMLHQGTQPPPVDFILPLRTEHGLERHQRMLVANCLAQSAALMRGKDDADVRAGLSEQGLSGEALERAIAHHRFSGSRPSNTVLMGQLEPATLGALIALYEHKVFAQSVIWGINAFDQWGVELGKQLANELLQTMADGDDAGFDSSTRMLLARFMDNRP
jgi:glucose-6-phosphate isomerase